MPPLFFLYFQNVLRFYLENRFIKCSLVLSFETITLLYFTSQIRPDCCMLHALKSEGFIWGAGWGTRPPLSEFSGSAPGKTDFLSTEEHITSPGCCLTLSSSLDVEQVSFTSRSVYHVQLVSDLSNLSASRFTSFAKLQCLHFWSSKVRCSTFLGRLLVLFVAFYFVVLRNFKIYSFKWYFVMPS